MSPIIGYKYPVTYHWLGEPVTIRQGRKERKEKKEKKREITSYITIQIFFSFSSRE
jgi:hypothetical protein